MAEDLKSLYDRFINKWKTITDLPNVNAEDDEGRGGENKSWKRLKSHGDGHCFYHSLFRGIRDLKIPIPLTEENKNLRTLLHQSAPGGALPTIEDDGCAVAALREGVIKSNDLIQEDKLNELTQQILFLFEAGKLLSADDLATATSNAEKADKQIHKIYDEKERLQEGLEQAEEKRHATFRCWATDLEMTAAAAWLNICILIWIPVDKRQEQSHLQQAEWQFIAPPGGEEWIDLANCPSIIFMEYKNRGHYNLLEPKMPKMPKMPFLAQAIQDYSHPENERQRGINYLDLKKDHWYIINDSNVNMWWQAVAVDGPNISDANINRKINEGTKGWVSSHFFYKNKLLRDLVTTISEAHSHCSLPRCNKSDFGKTKKFQQCSDCKVAKYCSRDHQAEHWTVHKQECVVPEKHRPGRLGLCDKWNREHPQEDCKVEDCLNIGCICFQGKCIEDKWQAPSQYLEGEDKQGICALVSVKLAYEVFQALKRNKELNVRRKEKGDSLLEFSWPTVTRIKEIYEEARKEDRKEGDEGETLFTGIIKAKIPEEIIPLLDDKSDVRNQKFSYDLQNVSDVVDAMYEIESTSGVIPRMFFMTLGGYSLAIVRLDEDTVVLINTHEKAWTLLNCPSFKDCPQLKILLNEWSSFDLKKIHAPAATYAELLWSE